MKKRITRLEIRQNMRTNVLPHVRKLVKMFDLPSVQGALKVLYEERTAARQLKEAEKKVAELKKKLS